MRLLRSMSVSRRSPIGLTFDGRSLTAVQVAGAGAGSRIAAASALRRSAPGTPVPPDEFRELAGVLERQGFRGRRVAIAVPAEDLLVETLEMPPLDSGAPVARLARMEMATAHRLAPDAFEFGGWDVTPSFRAAGGASGGSRLLAVGCPHPRAHALLDELAQADLEVVHLAAAPCALAGAGSDLAAAAGAQTVILDVGWRHVHLSLLHEGHLVSVRVLPDLGLASVFGSLGETRSLEPRALDRLVASVGADPAGASSAETAIDPGLRRGAQDALETHVTRLDSEIRLSVAYVAQEHGADGQRRLLVTGDGAECPAFVTALGQATGLETLAADPIRLGARRGDGGERTSSPAMTLAWALAVDAMEGAG